MGKLRSEGRYIERVFFESGFIATAVPIMINFVEFFSFRGQYFSPHHGGGGGGVKQEQQQGRKRF